jgi:hypothetical protein
MKAVDFLLFLTELTVLTIRKFRFKTALTKKSAQK